MRKIYLITAMFCVVAGFSQNIDVAAMGKPAFSVSGGISANTVFYSSDTDSGRDPFTYLLSGNLNISAFTFTLPVSYSLTNQGSNLDYSVPFNFNRLSLTPKYKWVKAYIGDAAMTFSPYTLNGHPFRGIGVELTPDGPMKISAMGGRLLKAVEAADAPSGVPVFERTGYGTKLGYEKEKYTLEWIGFFAKDNKNSIAPNYDTKGVKPQQNIATSLNLKTSMLKNIEFTMEYAISILTSDSRAKSRGGLLGEKESSSFLKAFKTDVNYAIGKSKVGLAYERVDPNYATLGALYMNNDLENIAVTFARPFLKDKLAVSANAGYQRDDLKSQKQQNTKRVVGSINLNYKASEKLNITGSYSNFTTYTNRNLNQFDFINNEVMSPADTLDYRQLSQNASANATYSFGKSKNHNLNLNYNIAGQANEQGGIIRKGQASTVQNINLSHSVNFKESKTALNSSVNYTKNTAGNLDNSSSGGSVSVTKKLFKEKLQTNLGILYNDTQGNSSKSSVLGLKLNAGYTLLKKHSLALSAIQMQRQSVRKDSQDLTLNFNYNYSF